MAEQAHASTPHAATRAKTPPAHRISAISSEVELPAPASPAVRTEPRADARDTLRAALTCAAEEVVITRNPAAIVRLPAPRTRKRRCCWSVDEARRSHQSLGRDNRERDFTFVLMLVLGLRKGEVLGPTWELVNLDSPNSTSASKSSGSARASRRQVKTDTSEAPLPLPELCVAALKLRHDQQQTDRNRAAGGWVDTGLVFTTRHGTAVEPRNSAAASTAASGRRKCPGSRSTAPARRAGPCWPPWTCTPVWPCRSCGTARSPSRWRSTPRFPRPPPAPRSEARPVARQLAVAVLKCCTATKTAGYLKGTGL